MDVVAASATMAQRVCSPVPIFSQRTKDYVSTRRMRSTIISKGRGNESDLHRDEAGDTHLDPFLRNDRSGSITPLSKDAAMGLVLNAATGRGWTTGSGMEGPSVPATKADEGNRVVSTFPWSLFTKSPRRRMLIAFTCKVCGQRTTRAINPHAYTDGTVFVQCCGCNVFHKLVDNLNLFQGMKCYVNPYFNYNVDNIHYKSGDFFGHMEEEEEGEEDGDDDMFPSL